MNAKSQQTSNSPAPQYPESPYIFNTYRRQPVTFVKGLGAFLWDNKGKRYLDFFSGLAVCGLGHADKRVAKAVSDQMKKLVHTSNIYSTEPQQELAKELSRKTFGGKMFFSNSGAESNECAIKLARRFGDRTPVNGQGRYEIIVFKKSFHGRTLATLSATGQEKLHQGFGPLPGGFPAADFGDLESVRNRINEKTCAIWVEPLQGEGGVNTAPWDFFHGLKALCDQHNLLLIFDEIQTGTGRSGKLFVYQHIGLTPDILTVAKGLANGLPLGVTIAKKEVADLFQPGDHGSTFGGGPVVCKAALAVLKALDAKQLARVKSLSKLFMEEISGWKTELPAVKDVRGIGLMIGIELDQPGAPVVKACRENGLLINCTAEKVIRLLPPFCLTDAQVLDGLRILKQAIRGLS